MNPTYDFTGQVAFVTGAGSGMGLAAARAFATSGAAVALADVDETAVHAAAKDLTKAHVVPWPGEEEEPYALPFHPLDLGEDALRALCGFIQEGRPHPDDVDAEAIALYGFHVRDPHAPGPAEQEAALRRAVAAVPPPRVYTLAPDGTLIERGGL